MGAVDDLVERVGLCGGGGVRVEGDVLGREEVVVVGRIDVAGLVANVLVDGAATMLGGGGGVVLSEWGLGVDNEVGGGFGRHIGFGGLERLK